MQLRIEYSSQVFVNEFKKKYRGSVTLNSPGYKETKTFWFFVHYPYDSKLGEMALYFDEAYTDPLADGVSVGYETIYDSDGMVKKTQLCYDFFGINIRGNPASMKISEFDVRDKLSILKVMKELILDIIKDIESYMMKTGSFSPRKMEPFGDWEKEYSNSDENIIGEFEKIFESW